MSYKAIRFRGIIFAAHYWHSDAMDMAMKHFQLDPDEFDMELNRDPEWHGYYYPAATNWRGAKGFRSSDSGAVTDYAIVVFEPINELEAAE